ncbi:hypothetical protein D3C78_1562430 [compost metagenome]
MRAHDHDAGTFVGRQHCPNRESTTECFGCRQHIRRHAVVHIRIQLAGTTDTGLDFIKNQQRIVAIAQFAQPLQERFIGRHHAALTLHRLDDHRAGIVINQLSCRGQIVINGVTNVRWQRSKIL